MIQPTTVSLPTLLTAAETAQYLRISEGTLRNWRAEGRGPAPLHMGRRVVYRATDVAAWIDDLAEGLVA
ncbi:DNA-binding protein [Corynebacterium xerosis]|uniref:helix-turn-helix transcriptional regulator n=1 Tax=Corynebacterium xerosis TaxID=1725 RepID=UPI000EACDA0F|nr:helix-turn-helix domain-containing protein [Corynebacterium xerosis]AYJ33224.1 DNA-binding protein [Corynebacterium xerosis]